MKFTLFFVAITLCSALALDSEEWASFKKTHTKSYLNQAEEIYRFGIWKSNKNLVQSHNANADKGLTTFWLKMNQFADLTTSEFGQLYNGYNASLRQNHRPTGVFEYNSNVQVPDAIDWRTQGYVTPVKDQGQCGSCWAFSTTGSLEGQHFKATQKLVSLSEQNLVDCSTKYGNQGCNGGLMDQAFAYIKDNKGIDTEETYPYTAEDGKCVFNAANVGATDTGFTDVKSKDEDALKQAIGTVGPVSVAIDASHASFQLYSHGVYHEVFCSQTRLDHGVLAVGYGTDSGKDFWIVKNSWAETWGDKGYIMMSRSKNNNCGIATQASFPLV